MKSACAKCFVFLPICVNVVLTQTNFRKGLSFCNLNLGLDQVNANKEMINWYLHKVQSKNASNLKQVSAFLLCDFLCYCMFNLQPGIDFHEKMLSS